MLAYSTVVKLDGLLCGTPSPDYEGTKAWRKANSIFIPLGPTPTSAWVLLPKTDLAGLDLNAPHTLRWSTISTSNDDASAPTTVTQNFPGLYIVRTERVFHGGVADPVAMHLVELADGRYLADANSDTGVIVSNIRSYANAATYLTGTTAIGTWEQLLGALWAACGKLGSYPGLPGGLPIDGSPEGNWSIGLNAYRTLNALLDYLDCAINPDPFSVNYSIVQLGAAQSVIPSAILKWDGEPVTPTASQSAATLNIYHNYHYEAFGQERDTEVDNNWAYNGAGTVTSLATNIAGASGSLPLWDDLSSVLDETGTVTNSAALTTRNTNRKNRYVTRMGVTNVHRMYMGVDSAIVPGGQVRAILLRNWGDGEVSQFGGTVTEYVSGNQYVCGLQTEQGEAEGPAWFDKYLFPPEREQYAPPDLGRHTYPSYPRLPNIVQVWHDGGTTGDSLDPSTTVNQVGLHKGRVKRWVNNGMATLETCWIVFVDDFDNKLGNIKAVQGDYYGPARLSGITSVSADTFPVYTVRSGLKADAEALVVFQLKQDLTLTGQAMAYLCELNVAGVYTPLLTSNITVVDWTSNQGCWQGYVLDRGLAKKRLDGSYDIVFMERPALVMEAQTSIDRLVGLGPPSTQIAAIYISRYQQGGRVEPADLQSITVNDPNNFFPRAAINGKSLSLWNDTRRQREVILAQQQGLYASAKLQGQLAGNSQQVEVSNFGIESFSPFNLKPAFPNPPVVVNYLNHWGEDGDWVVLLWLERSAVWLILDVNHDQRHSELVTVDPSNGSGNLQIGFYSLGVFAGFTITPYFNGNGDCEPSRPCLIQFADYAINAEAAFLFVVAEVKRIYGPAKWVGVADTSFGRYPIYRTTIGPQEFDVTSTSDVAKGAIGLFNIIDPSTGNPTGIIFPAKARYNKITAGKLGRMRVDYHAQYANVVEC
jgi:hypothetical protein